MMESKMVVPREPVRLDPAHRERAARVLARAFFDDVLYEYALPDPRVRARALPHFCDFGLIHAMVHGEVYTTPEVSGVACWLPPGKTGFTAGRFLRTGVEILWRTGLALPRAFLSLGREAQRRNQDITDHLQQVHKRVIKEPHWYLILLGVDPDFQGRGIGRGLLQPVLARADAAGAPCYLETQTESNVRFYEKLGFRVAHHGEVPGHALTMWSMVRDASASAAGRRG
jgi:GNAT superfamily N-acetyltransferase